MTDRGLSNIDDVKLIAAAAHELKNPLTVIRGTVSMLEGESFGKLRTKQKEQIRLIDKASRRLGLLVDGLIHLDNLSHENAGRLIQLQSQVERAIMETGELAADKDVTVDFKPRRLPPIYADPGSIFQLLFHLISSAIRHAPDGSIVKIESRRAKGQVVVAIHSSGHGISSREVKTIKQKIGRQRQPVRVDSGSSGLGMFIASSIADLYGGSLHAARQTEGSCITLQLPASKQLTLC